MGVRVGNLRVTIVIVGPAESHATPTKCARMVNVPVAAMWARRIAEALAETSMLIFRTVVDVGSLAPKVRCVRLEYAKVKGVRQA